MHAQNLKSEKTMSRYLFWMVFLVSSSILMAKEENRLKDKLWKACKDYVKETDSYKTFKYGKKELKKLKKKITKFN